MLLTGTRCEMTTCILVPSRCFLLTFKKKPVCLPDVDDSRTVQKPHHNSKLTFFAEKRIAGAAADVFYKTLNNFGTVYDKSIRDRI